MNRVARWLHGGGRIDPPRWTVSEHERLTLHHSTPWRVKQTPGEFLVRCSLEVIDLADLFGFTFPKPIQMYAFPTHEWLSRYYCGKPGVTTGMAFPEATAVAISLDCGNVLRLVRHELAHLYAAAWGPYEPVLKGEGLAVWCEFKRDRVEIDRTAGYVVKDLGYLPKLADLLDDQTFMDERNSYWNYALAGSFTRWVVRQRGWPVYRDFYRASSQRTDAEEFIAHFGMTLAAAERGWHRHMTAASSGVKLAVRPPRWGVAE